MTRLGIVGFAVVGGILCVGQVMLGNGSPLQLLVGGVFGFMFCLAIGWSMRERTF